MQLSVWKRINAISHFISFTTDKDWEGTFVCFDLFCLWVGWFACLFVVKSFGLLANFQIVIHCNPYMISFNYTTGQPGGLCPLPKCNLHFKEHI